MNVNTVDEVPDSSWFENRIGRRDMSIDELVRGPDRSDVRFGTAWTIVRGKNRGFHPGFRAIDRSDPSGTVYQIEVDPPGNPEMATGAEVAGAAFYHAFGYHTVDVYLTTPAAFEISPRRPFEMPTAECSVARSNEVQECGRGCRMGNRVPAELSQDAEDVGRFEYHGLAPDIPMTAIP